MVKGVILMPSKYVDCDGHVMEKVDEKGNVIGFSVMRVSALHGEPLEVVL